MLRPNHEDACIHRRHEKAWAEANKDGAVARFPVIGHVAEVHGQRVDAHLEVSTLRVAVADRTRKGRAPVSGHSSSSI